MFQGRQRFGFSAPAPSGLETPCRLGADLGENASLHLDPSRRKLMNGVDCVAEQPSECVGFLIG